MCPPDYFSVEYEINPWMDTGNPVDFEVAYTQWQKLRDLYTNELGWEVEVIEPVAGLPDMVFAANAGLMVDGNVAVATFRHPERQPESDHYRDWFKGYGFNNITQPAHDFEGEGDALVWNDIIFAGYPWRSDQATHRELHDFFGRQVIGLQLTDPYFYHLDTCFAPVNDTTVALYPPALTTESLQAVRKTVPNVIEATKADAVAYGLNSVSDGQSVIIGEDAHDLIKQYQSLGMNVYTTPISEFQKSGGGVKCMTLTIAG